MCARDIYLYPHSTKSSLGDGRVSSLAHLNACNTTIERKNIDILPVMGIPLQAVVCSYQNVMACDSPCRAVHVPLRS